MAFLRLSGKIIFTIFCLISSIPAQADEPSNNFKFTCMPEINYMEITTVFYGNEIDKDVREKYNMIYVQDFSCKINNSEITIAVNKVQPKEVYGDDGKMLGTAQRAFMDSMYDIKIMRGKAVIATVENFGSSMAPQGAGDSYYMAFIPQVISYDGYNVYYCRYFKAEHQCNFIRTDYKLLELKKNLQTKSVN